MKAPESRLRSSDPQSWTTEQNSHTAQFSTRSALNRLFAKKWRNLPSHSIPHLSRECRRRVCRRLKVIPQSTTFKLYLPLLTCVSELDQVVNVCFCSRHKHTETGTAGKTMVVIISPNRPKMCNYSLQN